MQEVDMAEIKVHPYDLDYEELTRHKVKYT